VLEKVLLVVSAKAFGSLSVWKGLISCNNCPVDDNDSQILLLAILHRPNEVDPLIEPV
jgi:hypothetical protein